MTSCELGTVHVLVCVNMIIDYGQASLCESKTVEMQSSVQQPLWPNGEGTGLLNQGLWVRVPPGVLGLALFFLCFFFSPHK